MALPNCTNPWSQPPDIAHCFCAGGGSGIAPDPTWQYVISTEPRIAENRYDGNRQSQAAAASGTLAHPVLPYSVGVVGASGTFLAGDVNGDGNLKSLGGSTLGTVNYSTGAYTWTGALPATIYWYQTGNMAGRFLYPWSNLAGLPCGASESAWARVNPLSEFSYYPGLLSEGDGATAIAAFRGWWPSDLTLPNDAVIQAIGFAVLGHALGGQNCGDMYQWGVFKGNVFYPYAFRGPCGISAAPCCGFFTGDIWNPNNPPGQQGLFCSLWWTQNSSYQGSPNDSLYGQTWTPADILSDGFGVGIAGCVYNTCRAQTLFIDGVQVIVFFSSATTVQKTVTGCPPHDVPCQCPSPPSTVYKPFLFIPQGMGQNVDELSGSSSISEHEVESIDQDGTLKAALADPNNPLLGTPAILKVGFPGMSISEFATLATMQCVKAGSTPEGKITFSLQDVQRFARYYIWQFGGPAAWSPGEPVPFPPSGPAFAANDQPCGSDNPRYVQGNPIDVLLVAIQNELGMGQCSSDPPEWLLYAPGDDTTLLNPNAYFDVPGALALRDGQFSGDWVEFAVKAREVGKTWLESQILKPLGLYWIALAGGQLSLKTMKFPPSPQSLAPSPWSEHSIVGIPVLDRWDIINVLQARLNVDDSKTVTSARTYKSEITYESAASIADFHQENVQQAEFTGLRTRRFGMGRAFILADRVFRRHAFGTPIYHAKVQLRDLAPELGDFISLSHPNVIDLKAGVRGIVNVLCEVIDRQPNWAGTEVEYKLLDTRFVQPVNAWKIAPTGQAGWTSGGSGTQDLFIAGDNGKYSDSSVARTIF